MLKYLVVGGVEGAIKVLSLGSVTYAIYHKPMRGWRLALRSGQKTPRFDGRFVLSKEFLSKKGIDVYEWKPRDPRRDSNLNSLFEQKHPKYELL